MYQSAQGLGNESKMAILFCSKKGERRQKIRRGKKWETFCRCLPGHVPTLAERVSPAKAHGDETSGICDRQIGSLFVWWWNTTRWTMKPSKSISVQRVATATRKTKRKKGRRNPWLFSFVLLFDWLNLTMTWSSMSDRWRQTAKTLVTFLCCLYYSAMRERVAFNRLDHDRSGATEYILIYCFLLLCVINWILMYNTLFSFIFENMKHLFLLRFSQPRLDP